MTRLYAVIGDPVAHSLSPLIHNRWIKAAGIDAGYETVRVPADGDAKTNIIAMCGTYAGLNVTLPHKTAALAAASVVSPDARTIGAANMLTPTTGGKWSAHNTDTEGFLDSLALALGDNTPGARVILIGAGGAARAAAFVLARQGVELVIVNRSRANAEALAGDLAPGADIAELSELSRLSADADLVVNSASLGHAGKSLPDLAAGRGRPFLDLSYGKAAAQTLAAAEAAGWAPHDGLAMLVGQAAAAFRLWFGLPPDRASALAACRQAVAAQT